MPWVKIDDQFPEHPKVAKVGPLAMAMQVAGLCYCNRKLTDGFIPRSIARTLLDFEVVDPEDRVYTLALTCGMAGQDVTAEWVIELLVAAGIWEEEVGGYRIHDFHDFQPSKADVEKERTAARERMSALRKRRRSAGSSKEVRANIGRSSTTPVPQKNGGPSEAPPPVVSSPAPSGGDDEPDFDSSLPREQVERNLANLRAIKEKRRAS